MIFYLSIVYEEKHTVCILILFGLSRETFIRSLIKFLIRILLYFDKGALNANITKSSIISFLLL